jgi:hypothetical protein
MSDATAYEHSSLGAEASERFVVRGVVSVVSGRAARGVLVRAFHRQLRGEEVLGETRTDEQGRYEITYVPGRLPPEGRDAVNLVVRVVDADGALLVESVLRPDAGRDEVVDLCLPSSPLCEYETVLAEVQPLLEGIDLAELVEDEDHRDVSFLAAQTGRDGVQIAHLVLAHRHAAATGLPPSIFYGWVRQGLPGELSALAGYPREELSASLRTAVEVGLIPDLSGEQITGMVDRLRELEVGRLVNPQDGVPTPLAEIFALAVPDLDARTRLFSKFLDHHGPANQLWNCLRDDAQLCEHVERLQLALQLATLTANHPPLVARLLERFDCGDVTDLRDLAWLTESDWQVLVTDTGGAPIDAPSLAPDLQGPARDRQYAATIHAIITDVHPTPQVARRLHDDPELHDSPAAVFLRATPDFDLRSSSIDAALRHGLPTGVNASALKAELGQMQRVFKIAPRFDAMQTLRSAGIGSALQVAQMGQGSFVRRFGPELGQAQAQAVHQRAAQTHATAAHLLAEHHDFSQVPMPVLAPAATPIPAIPDWASLFGSADFCACRDCGSVLSPAAYLTDLLHFLKIRQDATVPASGPPATPIWNVLFSRRPDLGAIELSCDNTNLTLPYVDLVNEILERAVEPGTIDWSKPLSTAQRASLQTTGSATELRATPQHVTAGAYTTLGQAPYPWELPFDLWGEQTRTCLGHLGIRRDELMTAFTNTTPSGTATPSGLDVATEYLGMSRTQRMIITGEPANPPVSVQECYGFPAATAAVDVVTALKTVRAFLDVTGLAYAELGELLRMRFVNPGAVMRLVSIDPDHPDTCDTTKLQIDKLDPAALDRTHRFVRLYRALDWTPRQLDRALAALQPTQPATLGPDTIRELATLRWLLARTGLPVERLLVFYAPIDTYRYAPDDSPLYDQVFLNPAVTTLAPDQSRFRLGPDRTELAITGTLEDATVPAALLGALGVTQDELSTLVAGPRAVVTTDQALSVANLSALVRTVTLAHALHLPITDLLRLIELSGVPPFPVSPEQISPTVVDRTRRFVEVVDALSVSRLSLAEIDAVLTDPIDPLAGVLPDEPALRGALADLRTALGVIFTQTGQLSDDTGGVTRTQLSQLRWDTALVEHALGTVLGNITYTAPLAVLPVGVVLPTEMRTSIRYDAGVLSFTGAMTSTTLTTLQALSSDVLYRGALQVLFGAPRQFVTTRMRAFVLPVVTAPLTVLPAGLVFPTELASKIFYDPNRGVLCCRGYLSPTEHDTLLGLATDLPYRTAVQMLLANQDTAPLAAANAFLTAADASALFDAPGTPAERFGVVLVKLQPYLRRTLGAAVVQQKLSDVTGLDLATTGALLGTWLRRGPTQPVLLDDFLNPAFVAGDPAVTLTPAVAPDQLHALSLLHRVALLLGRLHIGADQLGWVFSYAETAGWLDPASLPPGPTTAPAAFAAFLRLEDLVRLRDTIPGGAGVLSELFALAHNPGATADALLSLVGSRTGWDAGDLAVLCGATGLNLTLPDAFTDERALTRLQTCFVILARLGVSAALALSWVRAQLSDEDARSAWQTAKAKYTAADWAAVAGPLRDVLRERQRSCLVSYLVAHPTQTSHGPAWTNSYELYQYYLVDVEMSPCRYTSRIVLATNSVQLFVQRCLLNLEPEVPIKLDPSGPDEWADWAWMGKYRVWEANRRIFLYPENYFDPGLRPGKTPFFVELENTLQQKDVTDEAVEAAFRVYLEKLDAVARLQPCGIYLQQHGADNSIQVDILHAFARTWATPHVYYYRQFINGIRWTPWESVDLDIQGNHLIPVTWKGRLFVFWPLFVQAAKPQPVVMPAAGGTLTEATKLWQLQFAWSEYKNNKWQPKQLITEFITAPFGNPGSTNPSADLTNFLFLADAEFRADGNLSLSCFKKPDPTSPQVSTGNIFLSSSKALRTTDFPGNSAATQALGAPPANTVYSGMEYVETPPTGVALGTPLMIPADINATQTQHTLLTKTPGIVPFRILYPNHYDHYPTLPFVADQSTDSFFFVDGVRSYFVIPDPPPTSTTSAAAHGLQTADAVVPDPHGLAHRAPASTAATPGTPSPSPDGVNPPPTNTRTATTSPAAAVLAQTSILGVPAAVGPPKPIKFTPFYHPHGEMLIRQLTAGGVGAVLSRDVQTRPEDFTGAKPPFKFNDVYGAAVKNVITPDGEEIDFDYLGGYSIYNWELFFHAPLLLAQRLSANQRFAEAQRWFHTIFNPTDRSGTAAPQRFWQTKPFFQTSTTTYADEQIERVLEQLAQQDPPAGLKRLILDWRQNPFQPDLIARIRTTAYQKAVVMKYLDNLIAWADQLFRQNSMETITQATELYVLGAELLGRRPEEVTPQHAPAPLTYNELEQNHLDPLSNALIGAEHLIPIQPPGAGSTAGAPPPSIPTLLYFCVPKNDQLLGYWDTIADRLFKIRHCMNIEGVTQQLALFEPAINPELLVAATAAGVDLGTALADINAPLPCYRFATIAAKAAELTAELKSLGSGLLSALEKRDAEALARLRSTEELSALTAARDVRTQQVDEAQASLVALQRSREIAVAKQQYYASRPFMNDGEIAHTILASLALVMQADAASIDQTANYLGLIPDFKVGSPTTVGGTFGGSLLVQALRAFSSSLSSGASIVNAAGSLSATIGGYARRADDWAFQADQAAKEIPQIDQQIAAATLRRAIAVTELRNHDLQIANAREVDAFMRSKYTNQELYDWMVSQVSTLFFQSYQLAYDLAKRAEQAYRFELGVRDSVFIQFGSWDGLHKGLLAGERLYADLKRMDASYLELNHREYELGKRVSLVGLDPMALHELRRTGQCFFSLPEALFDLDAPGHYRRRIKSVSLTLPCVAGPYTSVNCTATLLRSSVRTDPTLTAGRYARAENDPRFGDYTGSIQSVVTSTGLDDAGLFEPNLRDERYLPFEGSGVISDWHLSLPAAFRQFDYDTITDVVLHVRYTAREGGQALADTVTTELQNAVNTWVTGHGQQGLFRAISVRGEFADHWSRFLNPVGIGDQVLTLALSKDRIPFLFQDRQIKVDHIQLLLVLADKLTPDAARTYTQAYAAGPPLPVSFTAPGGATTHSDKLTSTSSYLGGTPTAAFPTTADLNDTPGDWTITASRSDIATIAAEIHTTDNRLNPDAVQDLLIVLHYTLT